MVGWLALLPHRKEVLGLNPLSGRDLSVCGLLSLCLHGWECCLPLCRITVVFKHCCIQLYIWRTLKKRNWVDGWCLIDFSVWLFALTIIIRLQISCYKVKQTSTALKASIKMSINKVNLANNWSYSHEIHSQTVLYFCILVSDKWTNVEDKKEISCQNVEWCKKYMTETH